MDQPKELLRLRRYWDGQAAGYDREIRFFERHFLRDSRAWLCGQATGDVLEVAVGTGRNLEHYPAEVRLAGLELSPAMLERARRRAAELSRAADLREGDAQHLPYADASFDTVLCAVSLCAIPDERRALEEMSRVLRPGGLLLLVDHVASTHRPLRAAQAVVDLVSTRFTGEHWRRRPITYVRALGFTVERSDRFALGTIERLAARKPAAP